MSTPEFDGTITDLHDRKRAESLLSAEKRLNVFVLIVQLFEKVPALKAMAPSQSEPPFKGTQLVVLALFVVLAIVGAIRFRNEQVRTA